jgi:hypothetical protein
MRRNFLSFAFLTLALCLSLPAGASEAPLRLIPDTLAADPEEGPSFLSGELTPYACREASRAQLAQVEEGNRKRDLFLRRCAEETGRSPWCNQLVRPNPDSVSTFRCTYGSAVPHQLVHPSEGTWKNAIKAVKIIESLEAKGYRVCEIYNWWRPEPYNKNVGGAAGRHPYGTSVDVRFCSAKEAVRGFDELCKYRRRGEVRALGYYGNSGVHLGVGDASANTWGRACK